MTQTTDRTGKNFDYSTEHVFNYEDIIGSLVYPPAAQAEGWYFFSITALLIILLYLLRNNFNISSEPHNALTPANLNEKWIKLVFIFWIAVISCVSYGRNSQLFIFLWNYMPGFSALRVWGRLNIILVPIIAWLVAIAYASFEALISAHIACKKRQQAWLPSVTTAAIYAVVLAVQIYLYQNKIYDHYWTANFKHVSSKDITFITSGIVAFLAIFLAVVFLSRIPCKSNFSRNILLAALVLVATVEMRPVGANTWTYQSNDVPKRAKLDVASLNNLSFGFPRRLWIVDNTISLGPNFSAAAADNWYFERYVSFLNKNINQFDSLKILMGVKDGTRIYFSESIDHASIASFLEDAARYKSKTGKLVSYTGDELIWDIDAPATGYFSFIDNWDPYWRVFVDGKPAEIELLFGTFKTVKVTEGPHLVRFVYQPSILFP